ncbi:MAG: molybdopterin oxidoreductase family protein [Epsilonproteobacteria bacterium]|nr:molybdopterin oxidoreductase family protein [Campylobacterota bacterium]
MAIKTLCGFCGVGCNLEFSQNRLKGAKELPNEGLICKKGTLQHLSTSNRLSDPLYREDRSRDFKKISWEEAIDIIAKKIKSISPKKIGFYLSGQLSTEDYYVANKLAKGFVRTNHVDTNSRMCMASAVVGLKMVLGSDYVPLTMEDALRADVVILIGANIANTHVVFFNRLKKEKKRGLKIIVVDPIYTKTAQISDLYLQIAPGRDIEFLNSVAKYLVDNNLIDQEFLEKNTLGFREYLKEINKVDIDKNLSKANISKEDFLKFIELFNSSKRVVSCWTMGLNQSSEGVYKNIALMNLHILSGKVFGDSMGFLSLTGQPNAMGGREVGALASTLAVHLDYSKENVRRVEEFWNSSNMPNEPGLSAYEMVVEGNLDFLLVAHTDPIYHLPNRNRVEEAFEKIDFVVEINSYKNSLTSKYTNLILPALCWGEKRAVHTNLDRLISMVNPIREPFGKAKRDWEIFSLIGKALGFKEEFSFDSEEDVFNEYKEMTKLSKDLDIYKISFKDIAKKPQRWGQNLKSALWDDKKLRIIYPKKNYIALEPNSKYPFILLTIRMENHWHSMSKSSQFNSEEVDYAFINKDEAQKLNIKEGDKVWLITPFGKVKLRAKYADIYKKAVAVYMHYLDVNYLTSDRLDPLSKEPDFKYTPLKVEKC